MDFFISQSLLPCQSETNGRGFSFHPDLQSYFTITWTFSFFFPPNGVKARHVSPSTAVVRLVSKPMLGFSCGTCRESGKILGNLETAGIERSWEANRVMTNSSFEAVYTQ